MAMVERYSSPVMMKGGVPVPFSGRTENRPLSDSITYKILKAHNRGTDEKNMHLSFDALISHDITYVGIIQTARASGLKEFPIPYALTNCHNSLCAVGGTINEDDHAFGLSAAKKYGGIYVPANQAVIHQFAREKLAGCGKMILGSDSHTRYGCYGTMGVGEGGGELVKQLLKNTYDITAPEVVLVWVTGEVPHGIGPHDVALALVKESFPDAFVKNKVLEFAGPGIAGMSMDYRIGIDVMTTETSCLSSVWVTDDTVKAWYENIGRPEDYAALTPDEGAVYDAMLTVHLDEMESMIALPFHPSRAYTIHEVQSDPEGIFRAAEDACNKALNGKVTLDLCRNIGSDGKVHCAQGIIAGCSGGMYDNLAEAAAILNGESIGNGEFDLSVYPASAPVNRAVLQDGIAETLLDAGAVLKPCFCGPCFGAGDTPANNTLSIRHTTRNFANREGSKPSDGQIATVALMDARSIAATAKNGGILTAATDIDYDYTHNPAGNHTMHSLIVDGRWGMMRRWRDVLTPGLQFQLGGATQLRGGVLYNANNSNNVASARIHWNVGLLGQAIYNTHIKRLPITVRYQAALPVMGVFFAPDYDEAYYEIYLGNRRNLAHLGWWGNRFDLDHMLSADLHLGNTILRIGYRNRVSTSWVNNISTRDMTHYIVIGLGGEFLNIGVKNRNKLNNNIISSVYQ